MLLLGVIHSCSILAVFARSLFGHLGLKSMGPTRIRFPVPSLHAVATVAAVLSGNGSISTVLSVLSGNSGVGAVWSFRRCCRRSFFGRDG